jgi:uracil-DNA glycosylase family 4
MMNDWEDAVEELYRCPACNTEDVVLPSGNPKSLILIIGERPGEEEIKQGKPLVGAVGTIIRKELAFMGVDMNQFRITNLWLHTPNDNEKCFSWCVESAIKEAIGKRVILLLGSDSVKYFTNKDVSKVAGLKVSSPLLSAPIIMASPHPSFKSGIGEFRLSMQKFVAELEKENLV